MYGLLGFSLELGELLVQISLEVPIRPLGRNVVQVLAGDDILQQQEHCPQCLY